MSRRVVVGIALLLAAVSCRGAASPGSAAAPPGPGLEIRRSPSPFTEVTAGSVSALIPDRWEAVPVAEASQEGFFASPKPQVWGRMDGSAEGIAALWVDATRVGVPSDYYYLAANGPALGGLMGSSRCHAVHRRIIVDHRPGFMSGIPGSPGDYMARGSGVCTSEGEPTRWAFFVAAPGYGPIRSVGIPSSGLYVVVAMMDGNGRARGALRNLLLGTRFGGAGLPDFIAAARS